MADFPIDFPRTSAPRIRVERIEWPFAGVKTCRNHKDRGSTTRVIVYQKNGVRRRVGFYCDYCATKYAVHGVKRDWPKA